MEVFALRKGVSKIYNQQQQTNQNFRMTTLFGQSTPGSQDGMNSGITQPNWTQNQKKRIIPNHLVPKKKTGFHLSTSTGGKKKNNATQLVSTDQYNILSFGSQRRKTGQFDKSIFDTTSVDLTRFDDTANESIYEDNSANLGEDFLPTRSIHDLNDEILVGLNKPAQTDSFINKDPKQFNNIFNRDEDVSKPLNVKVDTPVTNESAVLVFGYPESISSLVIQHFQQFGEVLENFDQEKPANSLLSIDRQHKIIPIFAGKNWVKLTFDNPDSAIEALLENGVVFNGSILGVIPYSKDAIEKLQKRKLTTDEDIGGKNDLNTKSKAEETSAQVNAPVSSKIDIKDGSKFFLKSDDELKSIENVNNSNKNLTWVEKASKVLFGFHEL